MALPQDAAWQVNRWEIAALGLWALVAAWLFFRPHEFILGGADAGVYVNLGANIARTGGILIHDPTLAALDPSLYPALLRPLPPGELTPYYLMPAFYVPVTPAGLIIPQFYPLHPVWQAVAYALGGLRAELLITPLWGFLGALAVYFTTRRLWGWRAGMLALAALSVTALQVWFARYPTAEMLTQYLLWTGVWALIAWMDKQEPRGLWAALAGAALGQVFLTRIDAYFLLILPVLLAIWLWWTHDWRRQDAWFFVPFLLLAAHSLIHGAFLSSPYFFSIFRYSRGLISRSLMIPLALVGLAALALIVLSLRPQLRPRVLAWVTARRSLWVTVAAVLLAAVAVFGYFVRPHLGEVKTGGLLVRWRQIPNMDRENLVRLGWYLGPAGVALGVAGMCWMLVKDLNRRTVFLLGTGLFFSLLYLWRIQANPHQIYAMRRYVPVVLPFFIITAAYLINWLYVNLRGKTRWFVSIGLTLVWFSGILLSTRGFVSQIDYRGIISQVGSSQRRHCLRIPCCFSVMRLRSGLGTCSVRRYAFCMDTTSLSCGIRLRWTTRNSLRRSGAGSRPGAVSTGLACPADQRGLGLTAPSDRRVGGSHRRHGLGGRLRSQAHGADCHQVGSSSGASESRSENRSRNHREIM